MTGPDAVVGSSRAVAGLHLPARAGIGLRGPHLEQIRQELPAIPWLEVHSENYFFAGGTELAALESIREHYPISLHGVGMSLGGADDLDSAHLGKLRDLVRRIEPAAVSEHLCWSAIGGRYLNDLLPLPHTQEALLNVCRHVEQLQEFLGRSILVENVSAYLRFATDEMPESAFVAEVARRTGCQLLLDVNNIYVNACNHGDDAHAFLNAIVPGTVGEIHLAGHEAVGDMLIDTHSRAVIPEVWALYRTALDRFGPVPTLIEWDQDIPELPVLLAEAKKAQFHLDAIVLPESLANHACPA